MSSKDFLCNVLANLKSVTDHATVRWIFQDYYPVSDQLSAVALGIADLKQKARDQAGTLADILAAFSGFTTGQARIMELLEMVLRQLAAINAAIAQEPEGENLALLLRAMLVQLEALIRGLKGLPHAVAAEVLLETDGLVLPPKEC